MLLVLLLILTTGSAEAAGKKIFNLCKVDHPSDAQLAWECRKIRAGETPEKLFGDRWQDVLRFNRLDRRHFYHGVSIKVPRDLDTVATFSPLPPEYPAAATEAKFILIDLAEQFLGAYEYGQRVLSFPIGSGTPDNPTPTGEFRINAFHRRHQSSLYTIETKNIPYPMHYGLRFWTNAEWVDFWLHGRDLPGYPPSHGCVGLTDEEMQKKVYRFPSRPVLRDARALYEWVVDGRKDDGSLTRLTDGPRLLIIGPPQ